MTRGPFVLVVVVVVQVTPVASRRSRGESGSGLSQKMHITPGYGSAPC
jgi:hypothetical protein